MCALEEFEFIEAKQKWVYFPLSNYVEIRELSLNTDDEDRKAWFLHYFSFKFKIREPFLSHLAQSIN